MVIEENPQQKQFIQNLGPLKLILGVILFFSICLTVISFVGYGEISFDILLWMGIMTSLFLVLWFIGIFAIFM